MKKYLAMFLAAVCLFACFGVTAFADDPIVIGILQDTTGGTATLGKSVQKGVEDAIADINAIRANRGVEPLKSFGFADMKLERRKELNYEGHYLWDLARWGDPVQRTDFTAADNFKDIPFPSYKWALPIPQREIDINPNLVQNPEY